MAQATTTHTGPGAGFPGSRPACRTRPPWWRRAAPGPRSHRKDRVRGLRCGSPGTSRPPRQAQPLSHKASRARRTQGLGSAAGTGLRDPPIFIERSLALERGRREPGTRPLLRLKRPLLLGAMADDPGSGAAASALRRGMAGACQGGAAARGADQRVPGPGSGHLRSPLRLENCYLSNAQAVNLDYATVSLLTLTGCRPPAATRRR